MEKVFLKDCVFCKMAQGTVVVEKVWENDDFFCIKDREPTAQVDLLVIPKFHIDKRSDTFKKGGEFWQKFMEAVFEVAAQQGFDKTGFTLENNGGGSQLMNHEHIHIKHNDG